MYEVEIEYLDGSKVVLESFRIYILKAAIDRGEIESFTVRRKK